MRDERPLFALALTTLSSVSFSTMALFAKKLSPVIPNPELTFFRSVTTFVVLLSWMWIRKERIRAPGQTSILVGRGIAGFIGVVCSFYAISVLPLPIASLLTWSSPLFVIIFSRLFLVERMSRRAVQGVAFSFVGLLLLLNLNL